MRICYLADGRYIHTYRWLRFFNLLGHQVSLISFQPMEDGHVAAVEREGGKYLGGLGPFHVKRFCAHVAGPHLAGPDTAPRAYRYRPLPLHRREHVVRDPERISPARLDRDGGR